MYVDKDSYLATPEAVRNQLRSSVGISAFPHSPGRNPSPINYDAVLGDLSRPKFVPSTPVPFTCAVSFYAPKRPKNR